MSDGFAFVVEKGVLKEYRGIGGNVVIPAGVTSIGNCAFRGCSNLKSVTIPASVTSIGWSAFSGCSDLKSVTIPDSVTSIGESAFYGCNDLKKVVYTGSLESWLTADKSNWHHTPLMNGAVLYCNDEPIRDLIIPAGVTSIGNCAFRGCSNLKSVTIPASVTSIGWSAFAGCSGLTSVTISEGVTRIGNWAFRGCSSLTSVTIPNSVTSIGEEAFRYCSDLRSVTIPEGVTSIGNWAFFCCTSLQCLTIPNSVTDIGDYAFCNVQTVAFKRLPPRFSLKWFRFNTYEFRSNKFNIVFPDDAFATTDQLTSFYCKAGIEPSDKELAYLLLYQKGSWKMWSLSKIRGNVASVFNYMIARFSVDENASANAVAEYIMTFNTELKPEPVKAAMRILEDRKYKKLGKLMNDPYIKRFFTDGPIEEHPMESYVRERLRKFNIDPRIMIAIKKGIHYVEPKVLCSRETLGFIISRYAGNIGFDKNGKPYQAYTLFDEEADHVAAALDREELSDMLTRLVNGSYRLFFIRAWARYALDGPVRQLMAGHISMYRGGAELDSKGIDFYEALFLSDTREAMQMYDKYGDLARYANMRGMTAMEMRDSIMLPAFDFDDDGVKRYDIGGNTIEVSIAPDLSFRLFDVNKQKEIRSFPKKTDDPAKAEACAKEFAAFKKEVLAFAKQRTELLHKMHMSGEWLKPDLWRKVYVEHPVISKLAQLVVWQDEAKMTLMIVDGATVDVHNNPYAPQGEIRVAHVLDMDAADVVAWQQWLAKRGCVQLFEQVWEPVIQWNTNDIITRYDGAMLTNEERKAVKKALKLRGVEMRAGYMDREFNPQIGRWEYSNEGTMLFGNCIDVDYVVDKDTKAVTFGKASAHARIGNREMNAILLEMDKATLSAQVTHDNDAVLAGQALSVFTAAQISGLLNLAIDNKATRCTALLLNYKNERFPDFAGIDEFSLDW